MVNKSTVQEYSELKIQAAHIADRLKELQPKVLESVEKEGGKMETSLGKFSLNKGRTIWTYSQQVTAMSEDLKVAQLDEQEDGTAKAKEGNPSLTFNAVKI